MAGWAPHAHVSAPVRSDARHGFHHAFRHLLLTLGQLVEHLAQRYFVDDVSLIRDGRLLVLEICHAEAFAQNAADIIVKVIAFVGIFLGVLLAGSLLLLLLEKLAELPVIKTFNHLGGLAFGLVEGCLILMILSTLIYSLNVFMQIDGLSEAINSSILIKYFYINFIFK